MEISFVRDNLNRIIEGPLILIPNLFKDERGYFMESWNKENFDKLTKKNINFVLDSQSNSTKNVLRGLHYQLGKNIQSKLVRCVYGEIYDVIVDLRKSSKTFLSWAGIKICSKEKKQLWIPSGFAHGFLTITDKAEIIYKTNSFWSKKDERSLNWHDPQINIKWPLNDNLPILSDKDHKAPFLNEIPNYDLFE